MKAAPFTCESNTEKEPATKEETEQLCDLNKACFISSGVAEEMSRFNGYVLSLWENGEPNYCSFWKRHCR